MNPLQDPTRALQFAVEFAQMDLLTLAPRRYLSVLEDLRRFIDRDLDQAARMLTSAAKYTGEAIELFQARMLEVLRSVALHHDERAAVAVTHAGDLVLTLWVVRDHKSIRVTVGGSELDRMQYQLVRVLEAVGADKIRACRCGRLFVKVTKKENCSARCQSRFYMREQRARERKEDERLRTRKDHHGQATRKR
jgi:hypothetical protein